jgi:hypothetical protein
VPDNVVVVSKGIGVLYDTMSQRFFVEGPTNEIGTSDGCGAVTSGGLDGNVDHWGCGEGDG